MPMVHTNAESSLEASWRLQRLAADFPELTFLAMDAFWTYERARHVLVTADLTPNIVWDLGGPVCYLDVAEWVGRNGSATLSFSAAGGTTALLAQIEHAAISEDDKANILGANVARMFGSPTVP